MRSRLVPGPTVLLLLAVVTLVVPSVVLGRYGMFQDQGADGGPAFSWAMTAWLVGPYVCFAALLVWAARSASIGFRVAVAVTAVLVVVQSVVLDVLTLDSDEALAAVGVLFMPVFFFGGAFVLAVVGLVLHLWGRSRAAAPGVALPEQPRPVG